MAGTAATAAQHCCCTVTSSGWYSESKSFAARRTIRASRFGSFSSLQAKFSPIKQKQCIRQMRASATTSPSSSTDTKEKEDVKTSLEGTSVLDLSGNAVTLTDLWKDRTAVVAFTRHFGCILCRKLAALLASKKSTMDAAGVALIVIGPGNVDQAKAFKDQTKFPGEVYADPTSSTFDAFKFVSGLPTIFNPKAAMRVIGAHIEGFRQDWGLSFQKDTVQKGGWQQGGVIVAGPGKDRILYIHKDKEAGDDPDINEVIAACCKN